MEDAFAVIERLHIAWCSLCACALLQRQRLRTIGPQAKACLTRHAMDQAFRWGRMVGRLLRYVSLSTVRGVARPEGAAVAEMKALISR